jgi:hypothetical protein
MAVRSVSGYRKRDVVEHDPLGDGLGHGQRVCGFLDGALEPQELVEVGHEQVVLVESREPSEDLLERRQTRLEGLVVHDHGAHLHGALDGLPGDVGERAEHRQRRRRGAHEVGEGASGGDAEPLATQRLAQQPENQSLK